MYTSGSKFNIDSNMILNFALLPFAGDPERVLTCEWPYHMGARARVYESREGPGGGNFRGIELNLVISGAMNLALLYDNYVLLCILINDHNRIKLLLSS